MFRKGLAAIMVMAILVGGLTFSVFAIDFNNAQSISVNTTVTGDLPNPDSVNMYKINLSEAGKISITFTHGNTETTAQYYQWEVQMFDIEENELLGFTSKGSQTRYESRNLFLSAGTYYIRVKPGHKFSEAHYQKNKNYIDYGLLVSYEQNNGQYEIEQNDSYKTATEMKLGANITGSLHLLTDVDYYKFNATADNDFNITFTHGNTETTAQYYQWKLQVFDTEENELLSFTSKGSQTRYTSDDLHLSAGTYYVKVQPGHKFGKEHYITNKNDIDYTFIINSMSGGETEPPVATTPSVVNDNEEVITVVVNGKKVEFDQPPIIENGRTLVPLRAIFEALGAEVLWDGANEVITATRGSTVIILQIGSNLMRIHNGPTVTLDVPAKIVNGRTLVPVRAVSEAFDATVDWDGGSQTIHITSK